MCMHCTDDAIERFPLSRERAREESLRLEAQRHQARRSPRCEPVCVKEFGAESCDAFGQPCLDAKEQP